MNRDTQPLRLIEMFNTQCRLLRVSIKHPCGRHFQSTSAGQVRIKRLDGTHFFVLTQGLEFDQQSGP